MHGHGDIGLVYIRETWQTFPTVTQADSAPAKLAKLGALVRMGRKLPTCILSTWARLSKISLGACLHL